MTIFSPALFVDVGKFFNVPDQLEICNLGSSTGKYGFDYSDSGWKGANFATAPQSLLYDFKILKTFRKHLKDNALVLITISPFSSILPSYNNPEQYLKYYPFLPAEEILFFSEETQEAVTAYLKTLPDGFPGDPSLLIDSSLPPEQMEKNAESFLNGWKKEFEISDLGAPLSKKNREAFQKVSMILQQMLEYCVSDRLRPVLILPPVSQYFKGVFSPAFRKNYINDFIEKSNTVHAPVLDYMDDIRFSSDRYFLNSLMLNLGGRRLLAKEVLRNLKKNA